MLDERQLRGPEALDACTNPNCPIRTAVIAPITDGETVLGALIAYCPGTSAGLVRATEEVAQWVSTQVELAELDRSRSRTRAIEAELRAQISPHFVYNSGTRVSFRVPKFAPGVHAPPATDHGPPGPPRRAR